MAVYESALLNYQTLQKYLISHTQQAYFVIDSQIDINENLHTINQSVLYLTNS